jgi:hypothetical protein
VKSRWSIVLVVVAALLAVGAVMRPIAPRGGLAAAPGGLRAVAADFAWLRAYAGWEDCDAARTESLLDLVVALDPRPLPFWLNGARMIAYDFPVWRINAPGSRIGAAEARRIEVAAAERALTFLERAHTAHPNSAAVWIERANIELNGLHDPAAAAESYRRASELPGAPYFAARVHAELLRRLGRKAFIRGCRVAMKRPKPMLCWRASGT